MKTPRQLLFERHRPAEPKLDAVRQNVLASLAAGENAQVHGRRREAAGLAALEPSRRLSSSAANAMVQGWREFLLSCRWHLAGMTAAWLVIACLNAEHSPASTVTLAQPTAPSSRQLVADLRESRRQLAELVDPSVAEPVSAPQTVVPRRRSERPASNALA